MIRKGDRVFFADNSKGYLERCEAFARIVQSLGLTPVSYGAAGTAVRQSDQDKEMRADFYGVQAIVLYFGASKEKSNYEDHWVLQEIRHVAASGVDCLLYVSEDFPLETLQRYGYVGQPRVLTAATDFGSALQNDLERLIDH